MFYSFILSIKFYFGNWILFQVWSIYFPFVYFFKEYFILYLDKFLILDDIFEMKNFSNFCNIFDDI